MMLKVKEWWKSRTVWFAGATLVFAAGSLFFDVPEDVLIAGIGSGISLAAIFLRLGNATELVRDVEKHLQDFSDLTDDEDPSV